MKITYEGDGPNPFRSQLERQVAAELDRLEVVYAYELAVVLPDRGRVWYLPDFTIEGNATHLELPRWIECKPQQMLYTLRDLTGVTRRAGEYFKQDVTLEGLLASVLIDMELVELAKPKRLAELSGESVLVVGGVQGTASLSALLTPESIVFSRTHPFVNQRGLQRQMEKREREQRWLEDYERRQQEYREQQKREAEQQAGLRLANAHHFVTNLTPVPPRFSSSCYVCQMAGVDGGIYRARFSNGQERWERLCPACTAIARSIR